MEQTFPLLTSQHTTTIACRGFKTFYYNPLFEPEVISLYVIYKIVVSRKRKVIGLYTTPSILQVPVPGNTRFTNDP